jgi:hypothetical protein
MALAPSSPITGGAVTGLTSPTYTYTEDTTDINARRFVVTALGGTQTNVETHSVSSPFYLTVQRPAVMKTLPKPNSIGNYSQLPVNEFRVKLVKGVTINGNIAGQNNEAQVIIDMRVRVPAGSELSYNDPEELKAALSFMSGFVYSNAGGLYDLVSTGLLR